MCVRLGRTQQGMVGSLHPTLQCERQWRASFGLATNGPISAGGQTVSVVGD